MECGGFPAGTPFPPSPRSPNKFPPFLSNPFAPATQATLKPHQRLNILRQFLLPKFLHTLVFAPTNTSYLKWFDIIIRSALRSWLKLPKDTPIAFFYDNVKAGRLGISSLRHVIPDFKKNRLNEMLNATDPIPQCLINTQYFKRSMFALSKPAKIGNILAHDRKSIANA